MEPIKDYIPSVKEREPCVKYGHKFSWVTLLHRVYKTCSMCGHIELMTALEENDD